MMNSIEETFRLHPPSNPEVLGVQMAALTRANETKTVPGDVHLVEALLRIDSVRDSLVAVGVDLERATEGVARVVAALPRRPGFFTRLQGAIRDTQAIIDPLRHVRAKALAAGLPELKGGFALAVLVGDSENKDLVEAFASAGFSRAKYRWYVAHREVRDATCPATGPVRVVVYNDPFTPMELVTTVLTEAFARDPDTARGLMLRIHEEGSAPLALMDAEVAARALADARARADKLDFPLRFGVEAQSG
jgi:ATP-dependent Clp protease adapter protein ClpS